MSKYSFGIKRSKDVMQMLHENYQEFLLDKLSSRKALNCAFMAYHISEWVYKERIENSGQFKTENEYKERITTQCPSIQILRDIVNGTKHYSLGKTKKPKVLNTTLRKGGFSNGFSRGFDISILKGTKEDGSAFYFEDEISAVLEYWKTFFETEQL